MRGTPLTIWQILKWADAYYAREKKWPQAKFPGPADGPDGHETWANLNQALRVGWRGLPRGSSLARLLAQHRAVRNRKALPPFSARDILLWADLHEVRTGTWPTRHSGPVVDAPGETWCGVELALTHGQRGMPGGSSLARLLAERRQRRHRLQVPPLTLAQILRWADAHHARTRAWPMCTSGAIPDSGGETWRGIDKALRNGRRTLPGGFSLAQLLTDQRGVRNHLALPRLTVKQVLLWADAHRRRIGKWPKASSGPVFCGGGETWERIDYALRQGNRGLPGDTSLSRLLARERNVRPGAERPDLNAEQILRWADACHARTGHWPHARLGAVPEAPNETWKSINAALREGRRGLPGGSTLHRLLVEHRDAREGVHEQTA